MKKVLYITTVSRTINAFLIPHIEMLLEDGYEVHCACSVDKPIDNRLLNKGVKVYDMPFSRNPFGLSNIKAFNKLKYFQKVNNFDIVHVHTPVASIYGRLLKLGNRKLRTIYTAHGYHFLKGGSKVGWMLFYPIEKIMARLSDVIININKEDYEITRSKLKPKMCYLINGVGLELNQYKKLKEEKSLELRKSLGLKNDDFVVLMIAELNKNKNQTQLFEAMKLLKEKYPNIKALCVGDGSMMDELKKKIASTGLDNNVFMLGFRQDINELINISDIGVLMSYREGLPRNIMEFIACGRKVIATDIRGCRDLVCNDSVGSIVKVGDYEATAREIEKYYLLGDKRFEISNEIKKYEIGAITNELRKVYSGLNDEISYNRGVSFYVSSK